MSYDVPGDLEVLKAFGKVKRQLNLHATQALKSLRIGPKQALLLRELRARRKASPSELARGTHTDPAAAAKIIEGLIRKRWIERTDDPADRRRWHVSLTPVGAKAAQRTEAAMRQVARAFCGKLGDRDKTLLFKLLTGISKELE